MRLTGLVPVLVDNPTETDDESYMMKNSLERLNRFKDDFDKFDFLMRLFDSNKLEFFRLINKNPAELMPLIYTPTVGAACQNYSLVHQPGR